MKYIKGMKAPLAVLTVLVMALAGCGRLPAAVTDGGSQATIEVATTETAAPNVQTATEPATQTETRPMEGNLYLEGLPIVKEKETFTIFCDDGGLPEDKIMYPILEEQTNINVELMLMPYEAARERLNILLNSGDYPDVIGGWLLGDVQILDSGMREKIFIPIDSLIEKHSPKMREILDIPGVRKTMTLPDGHIYTIPYVIGEPLVSFLPWINTVWLAELGLVMPKTTEDLRNVLRAFKEHDPAGGGRTIPFSGDPNNLSLGSFAGWWGVDASSAGTNRYFGMVDDKIVFGPAQEGYKQMIKFFAELYAEGLVDPELFTQDLATWKAKGKNGLYGVSMAYGAGDFAEGDREMFPMYTNDRTHYDALPVLVGNPGDKPLWRRNGYGMTTFRTQVVITDNAKHPEAIIRWWDNVFQIDNSAQIQWGPFGIKLNKISDTEFESIPDTNLSDADKEKYNWGNYFTQSLPKYLPKNVILQQPASYKEKEISDALYEPFLNEPVPKAWVNEADADRLRILETDVANYMKQIEAAWVTGQADVETGWAAHLAQLEALGVPDLTRMRQAAIDGN